MIGIVTNNNDPDTMGRVKVALPWLAPDFETDWARVCQVSIGKKYGTLFLPDVGDEVLVGFEFGDVRRPYVLGGLINGNDEARLPLDDAVKSVGFSSKVVKSGFVSRRATSCCSTTTARRPGATSAITLGTKDDKLGLKIDQTNGTITLTCDPSPPESLTPQGSLTIETGKLGTIDIKTGQGGQVSIDGGAQLSREGAGVDQHREPGLVEIKGTMIKLN